MSGMKIVPMNGTGTLFLRLHAFICMLNDIYLGHMPGRQLVGLQVRIDNKALDPTLAESMLLLAHGLAHLNGHPHHRFLHILMFAPSRHHSDLIARDPLRSVRFRDCTNIQG